MFTHSCSIIIIIALITVISWYFYSCATVETHQSGLKFQTSMCLIFDLPAVFWIESIECFRGIVSRSYILPATVPLAPVVTGITKYFIFYISLISVFIILYFNFFSVSFFHYLSTPWYFHIANQILPSLFLIIVPDLAAKTSLAEWPLCFIVISVVVVYRHRIVGFWYLSRAGIVSCTFVKSL